MLKINDKTFMNLQEAVQWLLDNNALPFQSSANYIANTEIGMGTIVNPSPAKVRIGSLIFFADSKVSTVTGLTENGFICSDQYNNLVDDIAYVTSVSINASGHLITTLSDGQTIDAGIIKQVSNFSINASQHLIASFNDGTSTDLGAIFTGNVNIAGNFTANSIIENMTGYSFTEASTIPEGTRTLVYVSAVKTGNKVTFVIFGKVNFTSIPASEAIGLGSFNIPTAVGQNLYPFSLSGLNDVLDERKITVLGGVNTLVDVNILTQKIADWGIKMQMRGLSALSTGIDYVFRYEVTFLLNASLI